MIFHYALFERTELEATTTNKGRIYHTPVGDLRSVTTIINAKLKNKKLDEWRGRIGNVTADEISQQARTRGTSVHSICEKYLMGENPIIGSMPSNREMFYQVKPILDRNITKIFGIEFPLYSPILKTAGRTDGLLEWQGHNVVLDFKTARKALNKNDDRIAKYNLQTTVYSMMAEEMYQVKFPLNVIIVMPADYSDIQVIIKTNEKYRSIVKEIFI